MERPIRANANRHPAQILRDATQKCRTVQQKEADEAAAAEQRAQTEVLKQYLHAQGKCYIQLTCC